MLYIAFAHDDARPRGGWWDVVGTFSSPEEAKAKALERLSYFIFGMAYVIEVDPANNKHTKVFIKILNEDDEE